MKDGQWTKVYDKVVLQPGRSTSITPEGTTYKLLTDAEVFCTVLVKAAEATQTAAEAQKALEEPKKLLDVDCPTTAYTGVAKGAWYHEAVDFMVENGYMNGMSNKLFAVDSTVTRIQICVIMMRYLSK